ncbi:hypothetical protein ACJJTC_010183 [Scirpophaga incertulas]
MRFYFFYITIVAASTDFSEKICQAQTENQIKYCYIREILVSIPHDSNQIAVDKITNTLYFSIYTWQEEHVPVMMKIGSKKLTVLKGVRDSFGMAYDEVSRSMYFGGSRGIYKYNTAQRSLKRLLLKNLDVWWMFVKKNLYFIQFPSLRAYVYDNKTMKQVEGLRSSFAHQFVYDFHENIFFINASGLYGVKNNSDKAILLRDNSRFTAMAIDNYGQIYVSSDESIFILSNVVPEVRRLVNIDGVIGMTFDKNNNLIYTDSHRIVRMRGEAETEVETDVDTEAETATETEAETKAESEANAEAEIQAFQCLRPEL